MNGLIDSIVSFSNWHDGDATFISVGPAEFRQDIGPWEKGEVVNNLTLDYKRGYLEECDEDGEVVRKVAVKLVIDPDRKPDTRVVEDDD